MPGTFFGINTALRGLEAQQNAMDVTSHNIANASTPGYSRQSALMQTTDPWYDPSMQPAGAGQIGTGVNVTSITRAHDDFTQQQILYQNQSQAQQQTLSDTLGGIAKIYNDPTSQGFSTLLSNYFTAWQQLANNPSDNPSRAVVATQGAALAQGFNATASSLTAMQKDRDNQVVSFVQQINTITGQIAGLNQQIVAVVGTGQQPNDLEDKRDTLLTNLSQLADIQYTQESNGAVNVSLVGGGALVQGISAFQLATIPDSQASTRVAAQPSFSDVVLQGQTTPLRLTGGQLGGALGVRDGTLVDQLSQLNALANNVVTAVNGFQMAGYGSNGSTGVPFFVTTGTTAATMAVNPAIQNNLANIATASSVDATTGLPAPGDGTVAQQIAQLQENPPAGGTVTLQQQYEGIISALGVAQQQAQANVQTGGLVLQNLNAQQSSVSAVSLNEEASNLLQFQNAYQAAARVISVFNQTISDMIQQIGV